MKYSIKFVEAELEWKRKKRLAEGNYLEKNISHWYERLKMIFQEGQLDRIADGYHFLAGLYAELATSYLEFDIDLDKMKRYNVIAAQLSLFFYELSRKGFKHRVMTNDESQLDVVSLNYHLTKYAILANEYKMALQLATENTIEGALILEDYERAKAFLPDSPENEIIQKYPLKQCMWAIAYQDQKLFDKYIAKQIRETRKDAPYGATTIETFSLALVKLAYCAVT